MRNAIRQLACGAWAIFAAGLFGCAKVPPCTVSPVNIEETREDVKILEKDLIAARERAKQLSEELAAKKATLDAKKGQPEELRKKVEELKKGSGRGEDEKDQDDKESA